MTKRFWVSLALLLVVPGLMFAASCAKRVVKSEPGVAKEEPATDEEERTREERARLEEQRLRDASSQRRLEETSERERFLNENIHFDFDKSRLLNEAKQLLRRKARWLKENSGVTVVIQGHCDERGTSEYNMALGDRRARSAKSYLVDLGIGRHRLTTISYGEERPLDAGHDQEAWAKNRRAQFVLR